MGRPSNTFFYIRCFYTADLLKPFLVNCQIYFILFVSKSNGILTLDGESRMDVGERIRKFGTLFTLLSLIRIDSCFSPSLSVDRFRKSEMLVPWKEVVAVVAVGLWSMLSIAAVVNNPFLMTAGQTTPSSMYLLTAASPSCADTSSTRS